MALLITQQPDNDSLNSANNDSMFVVSGNTNGPSGITDYKYTADVYINTDLIATLKSFPDPDFDFGVFNMRNIPSSFLKPDFTFDLEDDLPYLFHEAPNTWCRATLQFGEEYLADGVFVSNKEVEQSNEMVYINASLDFIEQKNIDLQDYFVTGVTNDAKFLKADGNTFKTYEHLRRYLYFYNSAGAAIRADIRTYDAAGVLLGTYYTGNPFSANEGVQYVGVGYPQLKQISDASGVTVVSGQTPMIQSNVASYKITVGNGVAFPFTEEITFQIASECSKFQKFYVHWMNKFGGFDSWLFNKKSVERVTKTVSEMKKIYGQLSSEGQYNINTYDHNARNYYTSLENNISLSSDFLTDAEVIYLKDLFSSPVIYIENSDGVIVAANVSDTDYTLNKRVNNKIYSLVLNFKLAYNDYRQLM